MKVSVKDLGPCRRQVSITVEKETVDAEFATVAKEFAEHARLPGFRKGKAPTAIAERKFSSEIKEEAKARLIPDAYRKAIEQEGLKAISIVGVSDVSLERGKPLSFAATIDVAPSFKLPRYKGISLKGKPSQVTEEQVDGAIRQIRENMATFLDAGERPVQGSDMVQVDYTAECEGKPVSELVKSAPMLGKAKKFWLLIDRNEAVPGLPEGLVGAKVGETRDVSVRFPVDHRFKELAGKTAKYTVSVSGIRQRVLPEMNAEFFKKAGVADEKELRVRIRENLVRNAEGEEKKRLKGEVISFLLENTRIDVPDSIVEMETRRVVQDVVRGSVARGVPAEDIESKQQDIMASAAKTSHERVKLSYILDRIAEDEKVEVQDSEINEAMKSMAARHGVDPVMFKAEMEKREEIDGIKRAIQAEKTLDVLLSQAKVK